MSNGPPDLGKTLITRNTWNTFSAILNRTQTTTPWRKKNSKYSKYSGYSFGPCPCPYPQKNGGCPLPENNPPSRARLPPDQSPEQFVVGAPLRTGRMLEKSGPDVMRLLTGDRRFLLISVMAVPTQRISAEWSDRSGQQVGNIFPT